MKNRHIFHSLRVLILFLTVVPTALASNTWYVDGVHGNNKNNCKSPHTACKTIGRAISLASSGDYIVVAPASYTENLTIQKTLKVLGADASTTIIDGGGANSVVTILDGNVNLSRVTIQNGNANFGGGIDNLGTLVLTNSVVSQNLAAPEGGGIYNYGTLTINKSTITGNSAVNSTISAAGGGIYNYNTGTLTPIIMVSPIHETVVDLRNMMKRRRRLCPVFTELRSSLGGSSLADFFSRAALTTLRDST